MNYSVFIKKEEFLKILESHNISRRNLCYAVSLDEGYLSRVLAKKTKLGRKPFKRIVEYLNLDELQINCAFKKIEKKKRNLYEHRCKECGVIFYNYTKKRIVCSKRCRNKRQGRRLKKSFVYTCKECKKEFFLNGKQRTIRIHTNKREPKYCSKECSIKYTKRYFKTGGKLKRPKHFVPFKKRAVLQYDKDGFFVKEWDAIIRIEESLNINSHLIIGCCQNKIKTIGGYRWRYKNRYPSDKDYGLLNKQ